MLNRREFLAGCATLPLLPGMSVADDRIKVLLDTDIGSDIDDAVALAYLLRQPRCRLMGITTVTGDPLTRARLARALCVAADKQVEIVTGAASPLVIPQRQVDAPQAAKLNAAASQAEINRNDAVEFLRETIHANPGEIVLLAVGPMTNIAKLFKADPEIPGLLRDFVIMAGKYSDYPTPWGPTEWNAIVDPHAIDIVLKAAAQKTTAFGLDITWQVSMTPTEVSQKFQSDPLLEIVRSWSEVWFDERALLHFHDPLAAAAIFRPDICEYHHGSVSVDFSSPDRAGITHFTTHGKQPIKIAKSVHPERFFDEYFSVFNTHNAARNAHS